MQRLSQKLIALSIVCLSSCVGIPPKRNVTTERCVPIIEQIPESIDRYTGYCRCHAYIIGDQIGRISDSYDKPLNYCSKIIGFPKYVTEVYPFLKEWSIFLQQQEKN